MRVGMLLTDDASIRPAKQPISAASTYCRTMIGRVGNAGDARAVRIVADRVDVGARAGSCRSRNATATQAIANIDDRHRHAEDVALPEVLETVHARAPLHDVELEQRGLPEAGQQQSRCASVVNSDGTSA